MSMVFPLFGRRAAEQVAKPPAPPKYPTYRDDPRPATVFQVMEMVSGGVLIFVTAMAIALAATVKWLCSEKVLSRVATVAIIATMMSLLLASSEMCRHEGGSCLVTNGDLAVFAFGK